MFDVYIQGSSYSSFGRQQLKRDVYITEIFDVYMLSWLESPPKNLMFSECSYRFGRSATST